MNDVAGDREARIRALFPLVKKIARRVHRIVPGSDIDDLVGEGSLGLLRAVDTYDETRGPTLEQYASRVVAGAMLNGVRKLDPVSERVRRELREADRERFTLASERGEMPTQLEMEIRRPGLRRATVHSHRYAPLSLDGPLPANERLSADSAADPAAIAVVRGELAEVHDAISRLSPRQQRLVHLHYFRERSLHHIGKAFQISPQRASQLHLAALKSLRKALHGAVAR
jgi:RNA polymerase sigma factor for flagellar operon FliA